MRRTLKRACKFCKLKDVVNVIKSPQPKSEQPNDTRVEYVSFTKCSYCGADNA